MTYSPDRTVWPGKCQLSFRRIVSQATLLYFGIFLINRTKSCRYLVSIRSYQVHGKASRAWLPTTVTIGGKSSPRRPLIYILVTILQTVISPSIVPIRKSRLHPLLIIDSVQMNPLQVTIPFSVLCTCIWLQTNSKLRIQLTIHSAKCCFNLKTEFKQKVYCLINIKRGGEHQVTGNWSFNYWTKQK